MSVDADRLVTRREAPEQLETLESSIRAALTTPLDFPPLEQAVIPGDRIVIALDADTPAADRILAAIWDVLALRDVEPDDVLVLQPRSSHPGAPADPRSALTRNVASRISWQIHDPDEAEGGQYLATSSSGERVYLAAELIEADW
ncbi:MAG: hypothetical protein Ct9H300mP1_08490 [Planctomycetaceae bacterium]|nr:MAG: hypothetical protein Ct9H300mP1_08490 [Planctomycetaceae bacterium]